mmetsp:Transcript_3400/g.14900  ORF Transcript_3400/g.14900 Transcript_3400/m.14900 type:complete len:215 (-) Transcript_3400:5014-5658(-)
MHPVLRQRALQRHRHHHELLQKLARGRRQQVEEVDHGGGDLKVLRRRAGLLLAARRHLLLGIQPSAKVLEEFLAERRVEPVAEQLEEPLQAHEQRHGEVLVVRQVDEDRAKRRLQKLLGQRLLLDHPFESLLRDLHDVRVSRGERLEEHGDYPLPELRELLLARGGRLELGVRHGGADQTDARGSQRVQRISRGGPALERVGVVVLGHHQSLLE